MTMIAPLSLVTVGGSGLEGMPARRGEGGEEEGRRRGGGGEGRGGRGREEVYKSLSQYIPVPIHVHVH